jgi:hypothetical protein
LQSFLGDNFHTSIVFIILIQQLIVKQQFISDVAPSQHGKRGARSIAVSSKLPAVLGDI